MRAPQPVRYFSPMSVAPLSTATATRRPADTAALGAMVTLCAIWGLQQVAIKAAGADIAPALQVTLRSGGAAVLVWLFARLMPREPWVPGLAFGPGLLAAILSTGEFLFVAEGLRWTSASHMSVFLYTSPIFAAAGLHLALPDERLTSLQWLGIGLAFVGVTVTFAPKLWGTAPASTSWILGDLMGIAAGACWGLTTVVVRASRLSEAPPTQTLFYQLAGSFVLLLAFSLVSGQTHFSNTSIAWSSLVFQTVIVCFASYLAWFWLLRRYLASRLGVLSFMTPLFGVALGAILLHEPLDLAFIAGSVLVLAGVVAVNGHVWLRRVLPRWGRIRTLQPPR